MSLDAVTFPERLSNDKDYLVSKWNAVHHPVIVYLRREDRQVIDCTYDSGTNLLNVKFSGPVEGVVGDTVYVGSGAHRSTGTIQAITVSSSTSIIEVNWFPSTTGTQVGGYLNFNTARANYYAIINVVVPDAGGTYYVVGRMLSKPNYAGVIKYDASEYLKDVIGYADTFQYDRLNIKDIAFGNIFAISHSENWDGYEGEMTKISEDRSWGFVNSTKQIQERYGSNVAEHVPFSNYDTSDIQAKFLCDFERPTFFPGFPFSIGFIYSAEISGLTVEKHERTYDRNNSQILYGTYDLDVAQQQGVNRLMLSDGEWSGDTNVVEVWLETGAEKAVEFLVEDYVDADYTEDPYTILPVVTDAVYLPPRRR